MGVTQSTSGRETLAFDDCVFRICPMLSYRNRKEVRAMERARERSGSRGSRASRASIGNIEEAAEEESLMRKRKVDEEQGNAEVLRMVAGGEITDQIKYVGHHHPLPTTTRRTPHTAHRTPHTAHHTPPSPTHITHAHPPPH